MTVAVALVVASVVGAVLVVDRSTRRSRRRIHDELGLSAPVPGGGDGSAVGDAEVLDALSRSLRSGDSVLGALQRCADGVPRSGGGQRSGGLADELVPMVAAVHAGRPLGVELQQRIGLAPERQRPALRLLHVALQQGGATASALSDAAAAVRVEDELRADAIVQSSQAMASAVVVATLPIGFLALSTVTAPMIPAFLFGEPVGWVILTVGLGLDAVGFLWMRRMVGGVLR